MHTYAQLLLDILQLLSHPLAGCHAAHSKTPVSVLPADMREAQEVERLRLAFPSSFPVLLGIPPELDPARLVRVQFQSELSQPFFQAFAKTVCVGSPLEAEDDIHTALHGAVPRLSGDDGVDGCDRCPHL